MQMVISKLAFTFVDDATALVTGFGTLARDLTTSGFSAARARLTAPLDRLARACDVAGVMTSPMEATRLPHEPRPVSKTMPAQRRKRFDVFRIFATFRILGDLT